MSLRPPPSPLPGTGTALVLAEERTVTLNTSDWVDEVWLGEQRLSAGYVGQDRDRTPYIDDQTARSITLRLTDWVGRLPLTLVSEGRREQLDLVVYPAKLSRDPGTAFSALSRMVAELPELQSRLHFAGELPDALRDLNTLWGTPVQPQTLLDLAAEAWRLWQVARRQPHPTGRTHERRVVGGQVPDRVDWNRTLDLWGRGDFPQHVALDLPPPPQPPALGAVHELWRALETATGLLPPGPEREALRLRFSHARSALPRPHPQGRSPLPDAMTRHVEQLTQEVRQLRGSVSGLPEGRVRMAELYEFWAQIRLARALGAVQGEFIRTPEGLYTGTLRSDPAPAEASAPPSTTVSLNPRMSFGGVGMHWQTLQPDLLALFSQAGGEAAGRQEALVADVKYRPIDRMTTDQQREVNDQLLRYMGLLHAATGLVLWPGGDLEPGTERLMVRELPLGRARLIRLRLHPLDPPERLGQDLRNLGLLPHTFSGGTP